MAGAGSRQDILSPYVRAGMTVLEPGPVPDGMFSAELAAAAAVGLNVVERPTVRQSLSVLPVKKLGLVDGFP